MKANYPLKEGNCPMCNCEIDDYEETQYGCGDIRYPFTCKACAFSGFEVYEYVRIEGWTEGEDAEIEEVEEPVSQSGRMTTKEQMQDAWKERGKDIHTDCVCVGCPDKNTCKYAWDLYNFNCVPGVDCLAAK